MLDSFTVFKDWALAAVTMWIGSVQWSLRDKATKTDLDAVKELQQNNIEYIKDDLTEIKKDIREIRDRLSRSDDNG